MLIRPISDLHLEFGDFFLPPLETDPDTILVLAGDIGLVHRDHLHEVYIPFLARCNLQFRKVILIVGNHEHYGGSFVRTIPKLREAIANNYLGNVHLLDKETLVIDDHAFIGATLWTDCDRDNPGAGLLFNGMTDSKAIRIGPDSHPHERKLLAFDTLKEFQATKKFIEAEITAHQEVGRKTIVVVHHGVTERSIHQMFKGHPLNMFFASEMTEFWYNTNPTLIVHGHTHVPLDYYVDPEKVICQTRVVCNPRGYDGRENTGYQTALVLDTENL